MSDAAKEPEQVDADPESASEAALFFGISAGRLRSRARWAAVFLLLGGLLPYDFVGTAPLFLWDVIGELPLATVLATLALSLAGLAIFVATFAVKRASSLAIFVLTTLALVAVYFQLGRERAAWEVFSMPSAITNRPAFAILALGLTAAGANLAFRQGTRKLSRFVLIGGVVASALFYLTPTRGEAPIATLARALVTLPDLPDVRFQIGMILVAILMLWPLVVPLLGLLYLRQPPKKDDPWVALLATFGPPALLLMFVYRVIVFAQAGLAVLSYLVAILVVAALLGLVGAAVLVLGESVSLDEKVQNEAHELVPDSSREARRKARGLKPQIAGGIAGGVFVLLTITEWILARPPVKGITWELSGGTDQADKLFGDAIPSWQAERSEWQVRLKDHASAAGRADMKQAAHDVVEGAKSVDPGLSAALKDLTGDSEDLDLAGRRWYHLVEQVNEASRKARLPYYLDPTVIVHEDVDKSGNNATVDRDFRVYPYRIDTVNRYDVGGREFATLMVRHLGSARAGHDRLGFSRDVQPFALVVLDEVDGLATDILDDAERRVCGHAYAESRDGQAAYSACVGAVDKLIEDGGNPREAVLFGTERHELQHQIDGPDLDLSKIVLRRLEAYVPSFQDRVNRELSAYLAELTADGAAPHATLLTLAPFMFADKHPNTYHFTAAFVFEVISGKRIRRGAEPYGDLQFDVFADVLKDLSALSDDELRQKARDAYKDTFGVELATPKRK